MNRTLLLSLLAISAQASEPEVTFRANARVVTVDVMVENTKTRVPITHLAQGDFRLRIDGKERSITYFGRDGAERRPLAMLVYLNLAPEGGLRDLSKPQALESLAAALQRLEPEDEVAVFAADDWFVGVPQEMTGLTRDRRKASEAIQAAITRAQVTTTDERNAERGKRDKSMTLAIEKASLLAESRPTSQVALVYISDGMNTLDTMESRSRRGLAQVLQRENISFSALDLRMLGSYAAAASVLNPLGFAFGLSVTGSSEYLAKETGGVAIDVPEAGALGAALNQVLSSYRTRYSLGFPVTELEYASGRWHHIEVKLVGAAAKGKRVIARKGFFGSAE